MLFSSKGASALIANFDANGDGVIDREEFVAMVRSHPELMQSAVRSMLDAFVKAAAKRRRSEALATPTSPGNYARVVPITDSDARVLNKGSES